MFLAEVALGKEHSIDCDDWTLTKPPSGYDSIVARGRTEPGMHASTTICTSPIYCSFMQPNNYMTRVQPLKVQYLSTINMTKIVSMLEDHIIL